MTHWSTVTWDTARAGGFAAYILLTLAVTAGLVLRNRFTRMPYGDQAPFVRRDVYERLGGHPPWPLLEDWEFARRVRGEGRVAILSHHVETSPRRYLERGVARTVLDNWRILRRARRGESPDRLAERYRR